MDRIGRHDAANSTIRGRMGQIDDHEDRALTALGAWYAEQEGAP
jgi:hypothetical protein